MTNFTIELIYEPKKKETSQYDYHELIMKKEVPKQGKNNLKWCG